MRGISFTIPQPKIVQYLLNLSHKRGGPKAKFFIAKGFTPGNPQQLALALFLHAEKHWPGIARTQPYGTSHALVGPMDCPDGGSPTIMAVWKVENDSTVASLITAYPCS